jgi:hypothetical protein
MKVSISPITAPAPRSRALTSRWSDPAAGEVEAFPQEISHVLVNLIANGFYAAGKRQAQESGN